MVGVVYIAQSVRRVGWWMLFILHNLKGGWGGGCCLYCKICKECGVVDVVYIVQSVRRVRWWVLIYQLVCKEGRMVGAAISTSL